MKTQSLFAPETIGAVMSSNVPTCGPQTKLSDILRQLATQHWDSVRNVYVIDSNHTLLGFIDMAALIQSDHDVRAKDLMRVPEDILHPNDDQETAVFLAVKDNDVTLPVVDDKGRFQGTVTARSIINIMHTEHIEDALLASGVRRGAGGASITRLATERTSLIVRSRAPWLMVGLVAGLGLGLISSFFEESLQETVALAYFIPVVAYIADSVGTQSEAIAVRALATLKIQHTRYLLKELLVGVSLGLIVGVLGGIGASLIGQSGKIGVVVGLSLFVASTAAAVLASLIPIFFKARGKDPALASGPLATAIQDVLSVIIYFSLALLLL